MASLSRRLKINIRYQGKACTWCGDELMLGEEGAVCEACESPHHARCWDDKNGCGRKDCPNAPLTVLAPTLAETQPTRKLRADEKVCPNCNDIIYIGANVCRHCGQILDLNYDGPKTTSPLAKQALTYAIVGIFCCGVILGPVAFMKGSDAKAAIDADPTLGGRGLATAAQIIGIFDAIFFVISVIFRFSQTQ